MARNRVRVNVGVNYPSRGGEKRAEPGDTVDDIPSSELRWMIDQGVATPLDGGRDDRAEVSESATVEVVGGDR